MPRAAVEAIGGRWDANEQHQQTTRKCYAAERWTHQHPIGDIELRHSYCDDDAAQRLFDEMDCQRACQAYIWSHPIVSMTTWRLRQCKAFGVEAATDFVVLESLKEKRGIVTGNLTTPYILQFTNLKDGPLVVEYPAGMTAGDFIDLWQRPVADTGLPGPEQGKAGTCVVVGPSDDAAAWDKPGVFLCQRATDGILFGRCESASNFDPTWFRKSTIEVYGEKRTIPWLFRRAIVTPEKTGIGFL
jgi:hypothetical protein